MKVDIYGQSGLCPRLTNGELAQRESVDRTWRRFENLGPRAQDWPRTLALGPHGCHRCTTFQVDTAGMETEGGGGGEIEGRGKRQSHLSCMQIVANLPQQIKTHTHADLEADVCQRQRRVRGQTVISRPTLSLETISKGESARTLLALVRLRHALPTHQRKPGRAFCDTQPVRSFAGSVGRILNKPLGTCNSGDEPCSICTVKPCYPR